MINQTYHYPPWLTVNFEPGGQTVDTEKDDDVSTDRQSDGMGDCDGRSVLDIREG